MTNSVATCVKRGDPLPFGVVLVQDEAVLVAGLAVGAADAVHAAVQVAQACKQCREEVIKDLRQLKSLMKLQYE